jgi:hypothetical protein
VFENRVLKIVFGSEREEEIGWCRKLHNRSFVIFTLHLMSLGRVGLDEQDMREM